MVKSETRRDLDPNMHLQNAFPKFVTRNFAFGPNYAHKMRSRNAIMNCFFKLRSYQRSLSVAYVAFFVPCLKLEKTKNKLANDKTRFTETKGFHCIQRSKQTHLTMNHTMRFLTQYNYTIYSKGFQPGSDSRSCSVIVRARVVLKRTVVGGSDCHCHRQQSFSGLPSPGR